MRLTHTTILAATESAAGIVPEENYTGVLRELPRSESVFLLGLTGFHLSEPGVEFFCGFVIGEQNYTLFFFVTFDEGRTSSRLGDVSIAREEVQRAPLGASETVRTSLPEILFARVDLLDYRHQELVTRRLEALGYTRPKAQVVST